MSIEVYAAWFQSMILALLLVGMDLLKGGVHPL
jgi:hypothetical protein